MRIFGGKFHSTVGAPNQPDTVTIEDWRSLQLDIQVRFPSHSTRKCLLVTDFETLQNHDLVPTIEDALARISHLQPVQLGLSEFGEQSRQVLIEALPPVLVLHLKRFLYDVDTGGIVKISKHVQVGPELEIPLGTYFFFVPPC
jgi:ubiquitin carboxyl-terminal hydrolase 10